MVCNPFADYLEDVSKLTRHMAPSESTQIRAKHAQINIRIFGPQERKKAAEQTEQTTEIELLP